MQQMNRGGEGNWPHIKLPTGTKLVHFNGLSSTDGPPPWTTVAVFRLRDTSRPVRPAFQNGSNIQALRAAEPVPSGLVAMRVGDGDVNLTFLPEYDEDEPIEFDLVTLTNDDDPEYAEALLY